MHPDSQRFGVSLTPPLKQPFGGEFKLAALAMAIAVVSITTSAHAQSDALQRCRAIAESAARLACYDAIPVPARGDAAAPAAAPAAAKGGPTGEPVESAVGSGFAGWSPNERIRLANGQVWQVVDGTVHAVAPGARKAKIRRGVLGSFFLDIEGVSASPRVRRVQ
jgi:hypothetical protein